MTMNPYLFPYPPPPPPRPQKGAGFWILVSVFGAFFFITLLLGAIGIYASHHQGPSYSPAEQQYLTELHHTSYAWNGDDKELVSEGHQVCSTLNSNGGNRTELYETRLFGYGPDPMPDFLRSYGEQQRYKLVVIATEHFCDQYTLYFGGLPF